MKRKWFRAKDYGWGWTPCTWEGWVVLGVYLTLIVVEFIRFDKSSHSASDTLINFLPRIFLYTIVLIVICAMTGEKPEWRWGGRKVKSHASRNTYQQK